MQKLIIKGKPYHPLTSNNYGMMMNDKLKQYKINKNKLLRISG